MAGMKRDQQKAMFAKKHFLVKGSGGHGGSTKPNGIKIMDAEKTIKGMQIRRNKKRKELSEFLVKEMLKRKVPPETIIGGLRKAGVPNTVIKQAFDKNSELVKRGLG